MAENATGRPSFKHFHVERHTVQSVREETTNTASFPVTDSSETA
jgi:hypothetical protein